VLATEDLLGPTVEERIHAVRDALLEVDSIIDETRDPLMRYTMKFRQRFPGIRAKALSTLDSAIAAIDGEL
jgi:hypothetical protein